MDYSSYSEKELFGVLEDIDPEQYPQNAIAALQTLKSKFGLSDTDILNNYQDETILYHVIECVLFPLLNPMRVGDEGNSEIRARIQSILASADK
jgi:hypothetical protein